MVVENNMQSNNATPIRITSHLFSCQPTLNYIKKAVKRSNIYNHIKKSYDCENFSKIKLATL